MADGRSILPILRSTGVMVAAVIYVGIACAQSPPSDASGRILRNAADEVADRKAARSGLTENELNATMAFASEHHPELARLLEHLKKSRPGEFQRAMRELNQEVQGLEKLRERNPTRYGHNLRLWKTDSQIRVLVARWSRTKDEKLEHEIRDLLKRHRSAKLAQLKAEQLRLSEQLRKLESQIVSVSGAEEEQLDREWEQLAKNTNANRRVGTKNVQKSPVKSDERRDGDR